MRHIIIDKHYPTIINANDYANDYYVWLSLLSIIKLNIISIIAISQNQ
jgi:hypothetical protein